MKEEEEERKRGGRGGWGESKGSALKSILDQNYSIKIIYNI